jgi:hypothetical protein
MATSTSSLAAEPSILPGFGLTLGFTLSACR